MADLSLKYLLYGVDKTASSAIRGVGKEAEATARKGAAAADHVGTGVAAAGALIAAGVALSVKAFMDFDASMSQAQAATGATGESLKALRAAAIDAGAKTQFSATEAAQAITAMGKAGVSTKDILRGGLKGALALAAAGQLDVASASEIAATAMNQFGLEGKDIPHIADLLAAGAGKAMGSVEELAGALKYAGVVAKSAGWSIDETTGVLAEFAQAGIVGEQAGTSLRGVIMSLSSPSMAAAKAMETYSISMYDANGNFLKAAPLAQELKNRLGPLDEATRNAALGQIFGNEQITAARVLYEGGAGAVQDWTAKVNDAGFATEQAAMLTDNLKGDIERLGGSLSSVLIQAGSGANGMLRNMTKQLQGAVDLYGSLPGPVQQGATALAAVAAAAALTGGGLLVLAPRIVATRIALAEMGRVGAVLTRGLSGAATAGKMLGGPLVLATVALGYFANEARESKERVDELAASLDEQTGAVTDNTRSWVVKTLGESGALMSAKEMGVSVADVTDAVLGNADALVRVNTALAVYGQSLAGNADVSVQIEAMDKLKATIGGGNDELNRGVEQQKLLAEAMPATSAAITAQGSAAGGATGKAKGLALSEEGLAKAAEEAKKAHDSLIDSITNFGSAMLTARGDARGYEAAIDAAQASVKENGKTLDITTAKGRKNADALDAIASSALQAASSTLEDAEANGTLSKASVTVTGKVKDARAAFINAAVSMGMSKTAAGALATQAGLTSGRVKGITDRLQDLGRQKPKPTADANITPAQAKINTLNAQIRAIKQGRVPGVTANTVAGAAMIAGLQRQINNLTGKTVPISVRTNYVSIGTPPNLGRSPLNVFAVPRRAKGGTVAAGMPYIVGEHRPEVFVPNTDGTILPRVGTRGTLSSGGDDRPIVVQMVVDGQVLHQSLLKRKRTTGGELGLA